MIPFDYVHFLLIKIIAILSVALNIVLLIFIMRKKYFVKENGKNEMPVSENKNEMVHPIEESCEKDIEISESFSKEELPDLKKMALDLVNKYRKDIEAADLPEVMTQLKDFFDRQPEQTYSCVVDMRNVADDQRIVLIGDTHCDFNALAGIIEKLARSDYDYFNRARFIFMGDYLDRGTIFFEYIMLLTGFKNLLGERCIFLKGNHELIYFDEYNRSIESMVYPADTSPLLNEFCSSDVVFLQKFCAYFSSLPYYILLKTTSGTDFIVHGGIPHDQYIDNCKIDTETGTLIIQPEDDTAAVQPVLNKVLNDIIWSDPRKAPTKQQGKDSRFEFGEEQFEHFMSHNSLNRLFRSHEPVGNGVESFYGNRLYTIFSTGGTNNTKSGYQNILNPSFGIIAPNGDIRFESIFFTRINTGDGNACQSEIRYMDEPAPEDFMKNTDDLHLNEEFYIKQTV